MSTSTSKKALVLRFDREQKRPLSIAFVGAAALTRRQEFGFPLIALEGLNQLPEDDRKLILQMLQTLPLNAISLSLTRTT